MDIRINLLPPEILAGQEQKRKQQTLLMAGGVVLAVFVVAFGALFSATAITKSEVKKIQAQRAVLEQQAEAYKPYEDMKTRVAQAEALMVQAVGTPPNWAGVLADVGIYIPPTVWLTNFNADYKADGKGEVVIRGQTYDHNSVAGWLEEIRSIPGLADVRCQFSSREGSAENQVIRFEIKANIQKGPEFQPDAGKVVAGING